MIQGRQQGSAAVHALLTDARLTAGHELPDIARRHVAAFGGTDALCYLADLQQTVLVPFMGPGGRVDVTPLPIDTTLAGRAYQQTLVLHQESTHGTTVWVPMVNGSERLGVLAVTVAGKPDMDPGSAVRVELEVFTALMSYLITTRIRTGDVIVQLRREGSMGLAAELQWSLLPPLSFADRSVTIVAALEPAYKVAGDTVDYASDSDYTRIALFDGMGHGLLTVQFVAIAVAGYRHARRSGMSLVETCLEIDTALLRTARGTSFCTAVLAELDTVTGVFRWVNAGHPEPLLIRHGQLIRSLHVDPRPPLGIDLRTTSVPAEPNVGDEQLEPGDCVVLYTDGVTEARSSDGHFFGEDRLADLIVRNFAAGLPAPETMRRVMRALLEHQNEQLTDDATIALVQWPTRPDPGTAHP